MCLTYWYNTVLETSSSLWGNAPLADLRTLNCLKTYIVKINHQSFIASASRMSISSGWVSIWSMFLRLYKLRYYGSLCVYNLSAKSHTNWCGDNRWWRRAPVSHLLMSSNHIVASSRLRNYWHCTGHNIFWKNKLIWIARSLVQAPIQLDLHNLWDLSRG